MSDSRCNACGSSVDQLGRALPPPQADGYRVPNLTTDAAVVRPRVDQAGHDILMITRGREPFKGKLAFPGGFVDYGEDPEAGCLRELEEECGIKGANAKLVAVRGKPDRDPRKHIVTICYRVDVPAEAQPVAGDDAATAKFYSISDLLQTPDAFAFDHFQLLEQVVDSLHCSQVSSL
eukprot:GILK01003835.1.p1 GENE.GILK01003835.1~~GILK01003835.1.p1  ORF type:complete len:177 (-),score=20.14 GILK01003835.1:652-1182(-)